MKNSLFSEYRQSLKNPVAEELIDLVLYRPLAFILVKASLPLPLTPNFVSLLAMLAAITAGIAFSRGSAAGFVAGGLLFGLSNILDCSDGMIARLKKNGTRTGRIVDGLVDYIASIAVYVGMGIGLSKSPLPLPCNPWILLAVAGLSSVLHAITSDNYRNAFIRQVNAGGAVDEDERLVFTRELSRLRQAGGHYIDRMLVRVYLAYLALQKKKKSASATDGTVRTVTAAPPTVTPASVVLWNLIGPSTRITAIILAALLYKPAIFFVFTILFCNAWMLLLLVVDLLRRRQRVSARDLAAR